MIPGKLHIVPDGETLSVQAAQRVLELAEAAIARHGAFHVALAGGSTPRDMYRKLAALGAARLDWSKVGIWFGDERCVPPEHVESNYRMAREALLGLVPVAAHQVHRIHGELPDARQAAEDYARELASHMPQAQGLPVFDLVLLGMGDDGHTASLFPGSPLLEGAGSVVAGYVERLGAWRVSLTFGAINQARNVMLLIAGAGKAPMLREVCATWDQTRFPVQRLRPHGELEWFLDQTAAAQLPGGAPA